MAKDANKRRKTLWDTEIEIADKFRRKMKSFDKK